MPEPSTTSGRNLRRETQVLIEQAAVQQSESSASRMRSIVPKLPGRTARQDHEASVHTPPGGKGKAAAAHDAKAPSVHDRIGKAPAKERLHDTRGHAGDGDARYVINGKKYTPSGVDASTPSTIGVSHRSLRAPGCSAGRFEPLIFPRAFDNPPPSSNTRARPILRSGSMTTA